jgi:phage/plasmid-associated DNA primase
MLYESGTTPVQTNALFIEALNREPKARDKSSALQKRLVRFRFPNVYPVDKMFFRKMTSEKYLGALLSLLIDHYVREDEIAEKLKLTQGALDLQLEQVYLGSPVLQFLENLNNIDSSKITKLMKGDMPVEVFLNSFKPWCETQKIDDRTDAELVEMLKASFEIGWKTKRIDGKPKNVRMIKGLRPETLLALEQLKGGDSGDTDSNEELVGD